MAFGPGGEVQVEYGEGLADDIYVRHAVVIPRPEDNSPGEALIDAILDAIQNLLTRVQSGTLAEEESAYDNPEDVARRA